MPPPPVRRLCTGITVGAHYYNYNIISISSWLPTRGFVYNKHSHKDFPPFSLSLVFAAESSLLRLPPLIFSAYLCKWSVQNLPPSIWIKGPSRPSTLTCGLNKNPLFIALLSTLTWNLKRKKRHLHKEFFFIPLSLWGGFIYIIYKGVRPGERPLFCLQWSQIRRLVKRQVL